MYYNKTNLLLTVSHSSTEENFHWSNFFLTINRVGSLLPLRFFEAIGGLHKLRDTVGVDLLKLFSDKINCCKYFQIFYL